MINVRLEWIIGKKNATADSLCSTVFESDYRETLLTRELTKQLNAHRDDDEWVWKTGKGGYQDTVN